MNNLRDAIINGTFNTFRDGFLANYQPTNEELRLAQKQKWLDARNRNQINKGS
jgi:queuine tRNA-ribosyltransferase